ncbi:MAG: hypothetical protein AAF678_11960 [Pseudomonadota bacterium]
MILVLLGILLPQLGLAGPWPRGEGNQFLSASIETEFENGISDGEELFGTLYYERGIEHDLTLGFDGGTDPLGVDKAFGFVRWPVGDHDGPSRLALEFGFGAFDGLVAIRPALTWGRGFSYAEMSGWMSIDSRLVVQDTFDGVFENDFTLGLNSGPRSMVILQLQTGQPFQTRESVQSGQADFGEFFAKIAPSYVYEFKASRRIQLGLISGITGTDEFKLKLGFWLDF